MTRFFSKTHSSIGSVRPRIAASALPPKRVTEISLFSLELGLSRTGEEEWRATPQLTVFNTRPQDVVGLDRTVLGLLAVDIHDFDVS